MILEGAREWMTSIRPVAHLIVACFLFCTPIEATIPFLPGLVIGAFPDDNTEDSIVIMLFGAQQLIVGLGSVVIAPVLGSLSDDYGRKPVFKTAFFTAILPAVILAYKRTQVLVYIWFPLYMVVTMLKDGVLVPAVLAYVADVVDEKHRASAMGLTIAAITSGTLVGTTLAYFFKVDVHAFWTAAGLQISAAIYLHLFVKESNRETVPFPADLSRSELTAKLISKPAWTRQSFHSRETAKAVWRSPRLRTLAMVEFMNSFAMSGLSSFLMYFLQAVFDFGKNDFAVLSMLGAIIAVGGQMVIYPAMTGIIGERQVLWIALVGTAGQFFLYGFAWTRWVPYAAAAAGICRSLFQPAVGTMVSRGLHNDQQGKLQGFMGGVRASAVITAFLLLTPLAAISLVENSPLQMPGLTFVVGGASIVVAWLISLGMPPWPKNSTKTLGQPLLPDYNIDVQATP